MGWPWGCVYYKIYKEPIACFALVLMCCLFIYVLICMLTYFNTRLLLLYPTRFILLWQGPPTWLLLCTQAISLYKHKANLFATFILKRIMQQNFVFKIFWREFLFSVLHILVHEYLFPYIRRSSRWDGTADKAYVTMAWKQQAGRWAMHPLTSVHLPKIEESKCVLKLL